MAHEASRAGMIRNVVVIVALWEIIGRLGLVAGGALPAPSGILLQLWADRADYPQHVLATVSGSGLGFLIGNVVAVLAGLIFVLMPATLRLLRGVNIAIFALPPIAIAPILNLTLSGMAPRVTLAALGVYFVTMSATVIGLSQYDTRSGDVVRAYGGGNWMVMRLVRLRGAVPDVLSGLRIAAPNAVLGAILAEFGGGGRWGLGSYLLGSLGRGDPFRLWGIGLVATVIAGLSYAVFAIISERVLGTTRSVTLNTAIPAPASALSPIGRLALACGAVLLPFVAWWAFVTFTGVPDMIAKTPLGVIDYLFVGDQSAIARQKLIAALAETLPVAFVGMVCGLGFAFLLAVLAQMSPAVIRAVMPIALFTQTMPLVALTPLLVLLVGRGYAVTMWITISVTFFPAFVLLVQGISRVPQSVLDLPRAYGATAWTEMRKVSIPAALPYLFAATRLTVPRALLGVMIAEWLATGTGLGNLLNQSRGYLDYGMIWTVASVSVLLSVAIYYAVLEVERATLKRLGMQMVE
ncbi:ABC-type nitrate/sulfonate/bicarbonate transport system permease component [Amaricoccus macauensis]|uniref:ABC-type nitrate/sulfonate/bicarbonate transport system permease component n=1 Tax=Amaricoccus macauensis TaxID=57001 RepID=A0A840SRM6_9RHOB|nr:ABC transporter permease subunit [Amaricoccus macauensis]MBB5223188.1 ABC-type nitrate/sulfonate/bicarbonate transport system permease component [Amaricoccus macauensis]